jgi:hypothetical protein
MIGDPNGRLDPARADAPQGGGMEPAGPAPGSWPPAPGPGLAEPPMNGLAVPPGDHPVHMLGQLLALFYRLQAEVHEHLAQDKDGHHEVRTLLEARAREEAPRWRKIERRLNALTVIVLATAAFAVTGPDGLRQLAGWIADEHREIGVEGWVTLLGALAPLFYAIRRMLFVELTPRRRGNRGNDNGNGEHGDDR